MNIRCIIVDDEYLAIRVLEEYASKISGLEIIKTFVDSREALAYLQDNEIDLLMLDIQMPFFTGFEIIRKIKRQPAVIITTARHDFAAQAYEFDVLDYLVKPAEFDRFEKAVRKATDYLAYKKNTHDATKEGRNFLMIKAEHRIVKVFFEAIRYVEGLGEYIKIHTKEKTYTTLAALKDIESELPAKEFVRVHKSYIISIRLIGDFNSRSVCLTDGKEFPIGRSYKNDFLIRMK